MSAFAAATYTLFEDANLGVDALYFAGGVGEGVPVRVIRRSPDRIVSFGEGRFVADTLIIDVRVAEAPGLAQGDTFEIAGEVLEVRSAPVRDGERLVWSAEARPS